MKLDEAIKRAEEVAEMKKTLSEESELQGCSMYAIRCGKSAEEHRQLAKWLKELKAYKEQQPCVDAISRRCPHICACCKFKKKHYTECFTEMEQRERRARHERE